MSRETGGEERFRFAYGHVRHHANDCSKGIFRQVGTRAIRASSPPPCTTGLLPASPMPRPECFRAEWGSWDHILAYLFSPAKCAARLVSSQPRVHIDLGWSFCGGQPLKKSTSGILSASTCFKSRTSLRSSRAAEVGVPSCPASFLALPPIQHGAIELPAPHENNAHGCTVRYCTRLFGQRTASASSSLGVLI
jgi:hypothetical protein